MKRRDNVFATTALQKTPKNKFDLSHDKKLTFSMAELTPVCCMEALPGDDFQLNFVNMLRFMPLIAPVMHKVRVHTEYGFIPNRILWTGWEDFITGQSADEAPYILIDDAVQKGSVADYLGIPPGDYSAGPIRVSAFPFAAYYKMYDDWYRAQYFNAEEFVPLVPGDNTAAYSKALTDNPLRRAWEHDYFTSALPFTQQGTDVEIPLVNQQELEVQYRWNGGSPLSADTGILMNAATGNPIDPAGGAPSLNVEAGPSPLTSGLRAGGNPAAYDPNGTLVVDVQAEASTINDLREAFSLQAFLERSLRGGLRYFEQLWSHFGQRSPDARLQRVEIIGKARQNMTISEVLATAQTDTDSGPIPVGQMAGHGISVGGSQTMRYHCEEHGYVLGLISVLPDTAYQQGISKMFFKDDRLDYAWPDFANLGEQPVLNREIFAIDASVPYDKEGVFGYMPIYSEYRYIPSGVAGDFRDNLSFWTLGRIFDPAAPPQLNAEFITADPSTRIFAVEDDGSDTILAQVFNAHSVVRKLPRFAVPATLR